MKALSHSQQLKYLSELSSDWTLPGDSTLKRNYNFEDFKSSLDFVNKVGQLAERENHHPEILLSWGKAEIILSTHSVNGISKKDFDLAGKIEELYHGA
jgi:4a-hydroxytetrahydrobiopterin dehydratase